MTHAARCLSLSFCLSLVAACGDDHDHGTEDPFAEACEHLGADPVSITATSTAAGAPAIAADHKRYDVKLIDGGAAGKSGVVSYNSAAIGHLRLFLSADVPVTIATAAGMPTTGSKVTIASPCSQLKAAYEFAVAVGRYDLTIGGSATAVDSVGIVAEADVH
ncbi:MAG TPA: hypothetical protein VGF45_13260 [Polyangia bacterium]